MACNQCDGDGLGHSVDCGVLLHEKLDRLDRRLEIIVDILKEIRQEMVDK